MNRQFKISIGDWSGDGHGHCVHRIVECNMNINDVRAAFFKAREVIPKRCQPETVCSEYESYTIKAELADEIEELYGMEFREREEDRTEDVYVGVEDFENMILGFIKKGNPDLELKIVPEPSIPTLHFYGFDSKQRHIGFMGYGVMSN